eukprot:5548696-Lingulodinium_polyedra.AAC.1
MAVLEIDSLPEAFAGRLQHAVVERGGGRPLHVFNLYGFDTGFRGAAELNAQLYACAFRAA